MKPIKTILSIASIFTVGTLVAAPDVRMAQITVKPEKLDAFLQAVRENMRTFVEVEPDVISIYAVSDKDNPAKLTFFEIYADEAAYVSHTQTAHFKRYIERTAALIDDKKLMRVNAVELAPVPERLNAPAAK